MRTFLIVCCVLSLISLLGIAIQTSQDSLRSWKQQTHNGSQARWVAVALMLTLTSISVCMVLGFDLLKIKESYGFIVGVSAVTGWLLTTLAARWMILGHYPGTLFQSWWSCTITSLGQERKLRRWL